MLISLRFDLLDEDMANFTAENRDILGRILYFSGTVIIAEYAWEIVVWLQRRDLVSWLIGSQNTCLLLAITSAKLAGDSVTNHTRRTSHLQKTDASNSPYYK